MVVVKYDRLFWLWFVCGLHSLFKLRIVITSRGSSKMNFPDRFTKNFIHEFYCTADKRLKYVEIIVIQNALVCHMSTVNNYWNGKWRICFRKHCVCIYTKYALMCYCYYCHHLNCAKTQNCLIYKNTFIQRK